MTPDLLPRQSEAEKHVEHVGPPDPATCELSDASASSASAADALAEGFPDRETFLGYWLRLYPDAVIGRPVWVIEFEFGAAKP